MEENTVQEDQMHGSMFVLLKRFVERSHDYSTWVRLLESAGIAHAPGSEAALSQGLAPVAIVYISVTPAHAILVLT